MSEILEYINSQKDIREQIREELVKLNKQNINNQVKNLKLTVNQVVYNEAIKMMGD